MPASWALTDDGSGVGRRSAVDASAIFAGCHAEPEMEAQAPCRLPAAERPRHFGPVALLLRCALQTPDLASNVATSGIGSRNVRSPGGARPSNLTGAELLRPRSHGSDHEQVQPALRCEQHPRSSRPPVAGSQVVPAGFGNGNTFPQVYDSAGSLHVRGCHRRLLSRGKGTRLRRASKEVRRFLLFRSG